MDNNPPNANIHTIVRAQIVFLLSTLTEDNFERNQSEIRSLSEQHGIDTYLHFIRRLIVHSQARLAPNPSHLNTLDTSTALSFRLLVQEIQRLARDPFMADRFRDSIDHRDANEPFRSFDLGRFVERIGLRPLERFVLVSPFLVPSARKEFQQQALAIINAEFENAVLSLCQRPSFDHGDITLNQTAKLLTNLLSKPPLENPVLDETQRLTLVTAAHAHFGPEALSPVLDRIFNTLCLPPNTTLIEALNQFGSDITSDDTAVQALFQRLGVGEAIVPDDALVLDMFRTLAQTAFDGGQICDVGALVRVLSNMTTNLNWPEVIKSFDYPNRSAVDTATLKVLIAVLINSPAAAVPHAVTGFWTTWSNSLYQLHLLDALLSLPGDTFNFVTLPGRRIVTVDDVATASPTIKTLAANVQGHTWNSVELFEVLVRLAGDESLEVRNCVRDMLDKAVKISAELVHMGLLLVPDQKWNEIRTEYSRKLLAMFLAGHPNHQLVFMRIWQIDQSYLTGAFRDFYEESPLNITRIHDVAQDLKILEALLEVRPFMFALDAAALASRREYLNLDKWLVDKVSAHGIEFIRAVIDFLHVKMDSEKATRLSDPATENRTLPLNPQTITIFLRILRVNMTLMDDSDLRACSDVRNECLQVHPRLMSFLPVSDADPGFSVVSYNPEIEAEVDAVYKQMYDEQTTIDDVITMLQAYKNSGNQREQDIFSCMLHFLFDEYKFFQSYYPARELAMTGYLFGSLIQRQLIEFVPLGIAIRYILDAVECPPETNLFKFGVQALLRFHSRLGEWPAVCQQLAGNTTLMESQPELAASVRRAIANDSDASAAWRSGASAGGVGQSSNGASAGTGAGGALEPFTSIHPDLPPGEIESPPEEVSDKIMFIVNNLAPSNFDTKLEEMREQYDDQYARWFAHYLVDTRISTEPNNHGLYLRFLDALARDSLDKLILQETYLKSSVLLNAEKTMKQASERTILKNIGTWLGLITLARDKPIKFKNLSIKDILVEGYENSRLAVAIPFVCKTLDATKHSKVFHPPNPWLMACIGLLTELYLFAELRIMLKMDIEVLCKELNINLDQIEPSTILRNRPLTETLPLPDYAPSLDSLPMGGYDPAAVAGAGAGGVGIGAGAVGAGAAAAEAQMMALGGPASPVDAQRALGPHIESILTALVLHVNINPQLAPLASSQGFKRAVQLGVDRAVREIIIPVVERSVTIAGISTHELVSKDFASEPNEDRLRKAGHLMASKLAGSLALVTCKEPLKLNLATHLRHQLADLGFSDSLPEQVVQMLVADNLEIACQAIEKAAMERAVSDVDEGLASAYELRRRHREQRPGQPFYDPTAPPSSFTVTLPEPLRVKPSGLQPHQAAVYEDFASDASKRRVASRPASAVAYSRPDHAPFLNQQDALERATTILRDIEAIVAQLPVQSIGALPPNHDIRHLVRQIMQLANESDRNRTPLLISQKIVQALYKTVTQLGREVFVALLDTLFATYPDVQHEALTWLIYADDERKYNIPVTATLLRSGVIKFQEQDRHLATLLFNDPRPNLVNYVSGLIRECLSHDPPIASQSQFACCIEVLAKLFQAGKTTEDANRLLEDLQGIRRPALPDTLALRPAAAKTETEQLREKLLFLFQQWVSIFLRSPSPEKAFVPFINQITKQGILRVDDVALFFFRVCAESSVSSYLKCVAAGDFENSFQALDAMSRLIVYMIKYHGDPSGTNSDQTKTLYLTKILSIFVLVLSNIHEDQGLAFQQKPFFRFFSSLLNDLHVIESYLGTAYFPILLAISDTFSSLQPTYFPSFAFSWMALISHRLFMPKLLLSENRDGWAAFHKLLLSLFRFLAPFLKESDLQAASRDLYRGSLRLLLVLLHDFPEFLSDYYFSLCEAIPARCIQFRNIILSAFPPTIQLPDPYLREIPFEAITDMGPIPPILSDFASLKQGDLRGFLDQYLLNRGSPSFLETLKDGLKIPGHVEGTIEYDIGLLDSIVMYIGISSVAQAKARTGPALFVPTDPGVIALQYLATDLDIEGQHHLLSSMLLHLRYPNAHTHWFSSLMLHLFVEVKDDRFQEVMTKVLLERFIVHRPHPWGALMVFIELLRNPKYDFWNREFIRVAPEVTIMLESVNRHISP